MGQAAEQVNSITEYGAEGDGESVDTGPIERALEDGGCVRFPTGEYRLDDTVEVDLARTGPVSLRGDETATIRMDGAGPAFRFVGSHYGSAYPDSVDDSVMRTERFPTVQGLEIAGTSPGAAGIEATGTMQLLLENLLCRDLGHAIRLKENNRNVIVSDCHVYDNDGVGIFLDDVNLHQINVTNCHISYNDGGAIVVRDGNVRNLQVGSCDLEANTSVEDDENANVRFDMERGSMREGAIVGCTLQHANEAPESANVRLTGWGPDNPRKVGNFVIANNALSDVQYNVDLQCSRGVLVVGNTFWKGYTDNVRVENCSNVVIGQNLLDRNPDYGASAGKNGIYVRNSDRVSIDGVQINKAIDVPAAIELENCRGCRVSNATLHDCEEKAIRMTETSGSFVTGNYVAHPESADRDPNAIDVRGGSKNFVSNNYVDGDVRIESDDSERAGNCTF